MKALYFSLITLVLLVACEKQNTTGPEPYQQNNSASPTTLHPDLQALPSELEKLPDEFQENLVTLPAGSQNQLADAVAEAGEDGTVLVQAGLHHEDGTVLINQTVRIIGEPGAILVFDTQPTPPLDYMQPGIHVQNASNVVVWGLEIRPKGQAGGAAIMFENAPDATVGNNKIHDYQFGVSLQHANRAKIVQNTIVGTLLWQDGSVDVAAGVWVMNGDNVEIAQNNISNYLFGAFASDREGYLLRNTLHDNMFGIILCKIPTDFKMPSGDIVGSELAAHRWQVRRNSAHNSGYAGYLIIDGANHNYISQNEASNSGTYDVELAGETDRFGFVAPTTFGNVAETGDLLTKDCGVDNLVHGTNLVDTSVDPCF